MLDVDFDREIRRVRQESADAVLDPPQDENPLILWLETRLRVLENGQV